MVEDTKVQVNIGYIGIAMILMAIVYIDIDHTLENFIGIVLLVGGIMSVKVREFDEL